MSTQQLVSGAALRGDAVLGRDGEELGYLEDVLIDPSSGGVAYAVLACGGVLGLGEKLRAIPWRALERDAQRDCFLLDMAKEDLEQAPEFPARSLD